MRKRWIVAGTAALVLAGAGIAAGAGSPHASKPVAAKPVAAKPGKTVAKACDNGTYDWFNVERPTRLTGVSEAEKLGKGGGTLRSEVRRLATPRIEVTADGPVLASNAVLTSLGKKIGFIEGTEGADELMGVEQDFATVGLAAPRLDSGTVSTEEAGTFVRYGLVRAVEADFRYSCSGGKQTVGHAVSWTIGGSGVLECGTSVAGKNSKHSDETVARAAARLACGEDSVAARSGGKA